MFVITQQKVLFPVNFYDSVRFVAPEVTTHTQNYIKKEPRICFLILHLIATIAKVVTYER